MITTSERKLPVVFYTAPYSSVTTSYCICSQKFVKRDTKFVVKSVKRSTKRPVSATGIYHTGNDCTNRTRTTEYRKKRTNYSDTEILVEKIGKKSCNRKLENNNSARTLKTHLKKQKLGLNFEKCLIAVRFLSERTDILQQVQVWNFSTVEKPVLKFY